MNSIFALLRVEKIPPEKAMATHSSISHLPRQFHGQRSLEGYCPWGRKKNWTRLSN